MKDWKLYNPLFYNLQMNKQGAALPQTSLVKGRR